MFPKENQTERGLNILSPKTNICSSHTLYGLVDRAETTSDKNPRTTPNINFVDRPCKKSFERRNTYNTPPKDDKNERNSSHLFNHSRNRQTNKSPVQQDPNYKNKLSFRHSSKSKSKHQDNNESAEAELIISLKQIKRLREIIDSLTRDNTKLKKIVHDVLDGNLEHSLISQPDNRHQQSYANQSTLHSSSKQMRGKYSSGSSFIHTEAEMLKLENVRLNQSIQQIQSKLDCTLREQKYIQSSVSEYQIINKGLSEQNKRLKDQCIYRSNKICQLEDKILSFERNAHLDLRLSKLTTVSRNDGQNFDQDFSIVEQKMPSHASDEEHHHLTSLLKNQFSQKPRVSNNYESMRTYDLLQKRAEKKQCQDGCQRGMQGIERRQNMR